MEKETEPGKIPRRKLPEFKVKKAQIRDMKAAAKILDILAEKPEVLKKIGDELSKVSTVADEDIEVASYEAKQSIVEILSENLKDIPEDVIEKNMPILWQHMPHIYQTHLWDVPHIWDTPHQYNVNTWGPIEGPGGQAPTSSQLRRKYRW